MKIELSKIFENLSQQQLQQIFSKEKSFSDILGNLEKNENGLHVIRVLIAKSIFESKRLMNHSSNDEIHEKGFCVYENFLPEIKFTQLKKECDLLIKNKNIIHNQIFTNNDLFVKNEIRSFFSSNKLLDALNSCIHLNLEKFILSADCKLKLQHLVHRENDIETIPHTDTFFDTFKYWLFFQDTNELNGAFRYAIGTQKLTNDRLLKEYYFSLNYKTLDKKTQEGSCRYPEANPLPVSVKANSLIIANTFGIHCRGQINPGLHRTALHGEIRINPFEVK